MPGVRRLLVNRGYGKIIHFSLSKVYYSQPASESARLFFDGDLTMKNINQAKFVELSFLFLLISLLVLFNSFSSKAQNKPSDCKFELHYVYRYNMVKNDWEWVWDWVPVCYPANTNSVTSSGGNSSNGNSNSGALSEIRPSDLVGTWEGLFDKAQYACTLEIEKVEGNTFYGTLKRQGGSVAVTGTINSKERGISFGPTKTVMIGNTRDWKLGFNWGSFSNNGRLISGKGYSDYTTYEWGFTKKIPANSKASLSMKDRLPEQLGELKRVKLTLEKTGFFMYGAEEILEASYNLDKDWKAGITVYRYKDSAGARKRKEASDSVWNRHPILINESVKNQEGQVVGDLSIYNVEAGIAFLRYSNYFYEIVAKDKMLLQKILNHLPLE